jgi:DnaJ-domain-containing protein 1
MHAKQQAALEKRFAAKQKKSAAATNATSQAKKKLSALEQASRENVGYRNMDAQAEYHSWN